MKADEMQGGDGDGSSEEETAQREDERERGGGKRGEICPLADGQLVVGRVKGHGDVWRSCLRSEGGSWSASNADAGKNDSKKNERKNVFPS